MTDLAFEDLCLIFALGREAGPFLREFRPNQHFPGAPCRARFCGPAWLSVLVLESGVGREQTRQTLDWLFKPPALANVPYRPKLVVSTGFAGALQEGYGVGDILLATEVLDDDGRCWPTTWPSTLPGGNWMPPLYRGRLVTTSGLITDPHEKCRLGRVHGAMAVDMESVTVAQACQRQGVPFGCVRAISDEVETALSARLVSLLSGGRVSALRLGGSLLRAPRLVSELWRLKRDTAVAARQLAKALGELLTLTLPSERKA